ncbi:glutathione synthase [Angomonas deanei]|nr:glutathione synthase [Angomonas deanei]|eukprot:EPY34830.1 glutathione synthase [Angomonas deanei]
MTSHVLDEPPQDDVPSRESLIAKTLELGLVMRRAPQYDITHPALTLAPLAIHKSVLYTLYERQLLWNEAVDRTARQYQLLWDTLRETAESDTTFTGYLLKILKLVYLDSSKFQPLMLGIFRTDYMRSVSDKNEKETAEEWKNVEINTISCSFAGLSPLVNQFHRYLQQYKALFSNTPTKGLIEGSISGDVIPESLAEAVTAWKASVPLADFTASYLKTHPEVSSLTPIVLVVIQEGERNTGDQYKLLFSLFEKSGVLPLRRTHQQIHEHLTLLDHEAGKAPFMVLEKKYVVALVYYRSAYVPSDYDVPGVTTFEANPLWQARLHMEQSNAVKCPPSHTT